MVRGYRQLERNPEAELQLTHRRVRLYVGDNPVAGAVNAIAGTVVDRVVEHVEELRLELGLHPLRDGEVLKDRHIRPELARPRVAVPPDVAERGNRRTGPATHAVAAEQRSVTTVAVKLCVWIGAVRDTDDVVGIHHRREVDDLSGLIVEASRPHVEGPTPARAARPCIPVLTAILVARCERYTAS